MKKLFVAFCVLTISLFGVLGCTKADDSAGGAAAPTEDTAGDTAGDATE